MTYISSQSLTTPMRQSVMNIQSQMAQTQSEISTGVKADIGLSLGASTGTALSLQSEMDQLNAYATTNSLADTRLSATSSTLTSVLTSAQSIAQTLTEATGVGATSTLKTTGQDALQSILGALNTTSGNQYIFGGINTNTQPVAAYTSTSAAKASVDAAFQSTFGFSQNSSSASSITGAQMQSFLSNQFAALFNNTNWQANWSSASNQQIQTAITPSQSLTTSVSANDSSLRPIVQAYTMLSEFTGQGLNADANAAVVSAAGQLLSSGIDGLNTVVSGIGVSQSTLDTTKTQISSQVQLLTSNVDDLEGVDTAALSTKITQLQTQLQASYELTSKLAQLSLVNYLNG